MAIQSSGQISFSDIATELGLSLANGVDMRGMSSDFGLSTPDSINEFYGLSDAISYAVVVNNGTVTSKGGDSYGLIQGAGSIASGNPMGTAGFGTNVNLTTAAQSLSLSQIRMGLTNASGSAFDPTWWSTVTISKSGQTDITLSRTSAATQPSGTSIYSGTWAWSGYGSLNQIFNGGQATWTFNE